ncbi:hypothetical protein EG68_03157 [Paragonimus skrjabini miyazakii]|uniref:UBC core domain-containing protein n=1 Tax=Paragonimus skrjabini miyazakii TaxID=59628 RepID=A0A8S9YZQ6_9TREM|nr:hypothetical protein EG68_03157 [Paragonimus skrjabini miyazakii]
MSVTYNTRNPAVKRLLKEAQELSEPTELYHAQPLEDNLFEWHFTIRGPEDTEFSGGLYHGRILLPSEYPMRPPNIVLLTPNGRFETHRKICLSISGYHPESWRPSWSIRTALLAIIGFMPTHGAGAIGSLDLPKEERRALARSSLSYVCDTCGSAQNLLRPLTDASRSINKEAMEAASQISMMGDGSGDGNKEEATSSSSASVPEPDKMTTHPAPATPSKPAASTTVLPPPREAEITTSVCSTPNVDYHLNSTQSNLPGLSVDRPQSWGTSVPNYFDTPPQIAYWLCYPVYHPLPLLPTVHGNPADVRSNLTSATSLTTTVTAADGERVPLSFTDWIKQMREKRTTSGPSSSPDPASAPLTRAVVTNSTTCLSHRASASFKVHRAPEDTQIRAKLLTTTSSVSEEASMHTKTASHSLSNDASSSESSKDTVIERATEEGHQDAVPLVDPVANGLNEILPDGDELGDSQERKTKPIGKTTVNPPSDPSTSLVVNVTNGSVLEEKSVSEEASPAVNEKFAEISLTAIEVVETSQASEQDAEPSDLCADTIEKPHDSPVEQITLRSRVASGSLRTAQNEYEQSSSIVSRRVASPAERILTSTSRPGSADVRVTTSTTSRTSRSTSSNPATNNMQYRAVTVCAAGVAVALFLVVMRRLSLMLHGI